MLKLVVFDCDGVMFSSREANRHYYNDLLAAFSCPPMNADELEYVHIHNVHNSVAHIFRHYQQIPREAIEDFRSRLDYKRYMRYMCIEPDLLTFLQRLKPNYLTAISTNRTDTMDSILETFALTPWFDMVVTASNAPRPKPAPDGLEMILARFGLSPKEAIYIGDSILDQEHCQGAGVDLIAFRNAALAARYHVQNFLSILELPPFHAAGNR